jgi:hypothetical protein
MPRARWRYARAGGETSRASVPDPSSGGSGSLSTSRRGGRCSALRMSAGRTTPDEIWFLEHPPVFTLGMNASAAHVLAPGDIPVVQIDRGGQVTYHGPGQLVVYPLVDLRRAGLGIRDLVTALERSIIDLAADVASVKLGAARPGCTSMGESSRAWAFACVGARAITGSR